MNAASSIRISLPDGSVREMTRGATGADLAAAIGPGLAKAALAMRVDGKLLDLSHALDRDASVQIVTRKDAEALELIRHDTAHILAMAVQALFPGTQVTIGPIIDDGFYYDFARNEPFTPDDFPRIEEKMREIVDRDYPTSREVWDRAQAIANFRDMGEIYKSEIIADLPASEPISIYRHGPWHDLCLGPHLPSTGKIGKAFKLTKVAGAYWRGDHRNAQLQRIYGTAWRDEKELAAYLLRLEEADKRDHRKIGREMELFHIQEEATGQIFWHPKGWALYRVLENYVRRRIATAGYLEVKTPQLVDRKLWEASGHWENYREHMFIAEVDEGDHKGKRVLAVKPMNCPGHVQIFNQGLKSYRDLPMRLAEFGSCHRNEPSGALHGIMRVRGFVQDDAHIFCTEDQLQSEAIAFNKLLYAMYRDLGFEKVQLKLSTRPEKRTGGDDVWDKAEKALADACASMGLEFTLNPGEGAFYGPKLEFTLFDAIGRGWQCGTLQCDFNLGKLLGAEYVGEDGAKHTPVVLHRAVLGSMERFIGVLIEHYAGKFPLWLAPVQAVVATIVSDADAYVAEVAAKLRAEGLRVETDTRNEKINYKVREHSLAKAPIMLIAGKREAAEGTLTVRRLGVEAQENLALTNVISILRAEASPPDLRN
jgi:threonyl-tRNA synthetase